MQTLPGKLKKEIRTRMQGFCLTQLKALMWLQEGKTSNLGEEGMSTELQIVSELPKEPLVEFIRSAIAEIQFCNSKVDAAKKDGFGGKAGQFIFKWVTRGQHTYEDIEYYQLVLNKALQTIINSGLKLLEALDESFDNDTTHTHFAAECFAFLESLSLEGATALKEKYQQKRTIALG